MDHFAKQHWNNVYSTKAEDEVSWFQPYPEISMRLIESLNIPLSANIIDIGCGESLLADTLLEKGYQNIWALDISEKAIETTKKRLEDKASKIHWIISDITEFEPPVTFDIWHDRATFHFLISEEKINRYISIAEKAVSENGYLILGTFSERGPKKCSGLDIKQYSEDSLPARFKASFEKIKCIYEDHRTPFNTVQNFLFCFFRKK